MFSSMSVYTQIFLLILLIIGNAFLAASEISFAGVRRTRLEAFRDEGYTSAKLVLETADNPGKFFSVIQVGINMVAILGGIIGEDALTPLFSWCFEKFMPVHYAGRLGFFCSFMTVTLAFVIFSDLIPKRVSLNNPERIAMFCARPMRVLIIIFRPLVFVLEIVSSGIMRMFGLATERTDKVTGEDILATVSAGAAAGVIAPSERAVIENVVALENRTVTAAMTARESIVYFTYDDTAEDIRTKIAGATGNHFLVADGDLDHVKGCIETRDLVLQLMRGEKMSLKDSDLVQPVEFVPDTLTLSEILDNFQKTSTEIATVLNEYGLVVGVITLRDVMSSVMSDLVITPDEAQILSKNENSWVVDGATPTIDFMRELEISEMPESQSYETIAGFVMYMLRKIPKRGDYFDWDGFRFEVISVQQNKTTQVQVTRLSALANKNQKAKAEAAAAKEQPANEASQEQATPEA
jgi:CBS domain containing-hemolysin-like protein